MTVQPGNRHPVDELADVRAEIKRLKAREDELRGVLLAALPSALIGDENVASISVQQIERIDTELLKRELGRELLEPFMKDSVVQTIRIKPKQAEAA